MHREKILIFPPEEQYPSFNHKILKSCALLTRANNWTVLMHPCSLCGLWETQCGNTRQLCLDFESWGHRDLQGTGYGQQPP